MAKGILEKKISEYNCSRDSAVYCFSAQTVPNSRPFLVASTFAQELDGFYLLFIRFGDRPPKLFGVAKDLTEADKRNYKKLKFGYSKIYNSFEDRTKRPKKEPTSKENQKEDSVVDPYLEGIMRRVSETR